MILICYALAFMWIGYYRWDGVRELEPVESKTPGMFVPPAKWRPNERNF